jgi:hypothetical protein
MRYVFTPPNRRHNLLVAGVLVSQGDEFDASEAFAAGQPAGWVTPAVEYLAAQAEASAREAAQVAEAEAVASGRSRRARIGTTEVEETLVAAADPATDAELLELNGAPQEDANGDEPVPEGNPAPAAPSVPAKRGPGRPPKASA